jgi:hypothetical protein
MTSYEAPMTSGTNEPRREEIARAIYDTSTEWLIRGGVPKRLICSFEELEGRDRNLHLAYADAVLALPQPVTAHQNSSSGTEDALAKMLEIIAVQRADSDLSQQVLGLLVRDNRENLRQAAALLRGAAQGSHAPQPASNAGGVDRAMKNDPRLKQAMDAMDWFGSNREWLVRATANWYSHEKGLEIFDKLRVLDAAREQLRQMYVDGGGGG